MLNYKSWEFSYSIRETNFGKPAFFIYLMINCKGVTYQVAQKNLDYSFPTELAAKKRIMKLLKDKCIGTKAEQKMKALPIFDNGYQETLF